MKTLEDAYATLGVSCTASMENVRAAYLSAARKHHPDKLSHLDDDERAHHEAIFKNVTDAYSRIVESRATAESNIDAEAFMHAWQAPTRPEEWEAIWQGVERIISNSDVLCTVKDLLVKAHRFKKQWRHAKEQEAEAKRETEQSSASISVSVASLKVTASDVQSGRKRKVRVVKKDDTQAPVQIVVDCGVFPNPYREGNLEIQLVMCDENVTEYDSGVWDLFRTLELSLHDWFTGGDFNIPPLHEAGKPLVVALPPCQDTQVPLQMDDADFWKFGPIYVSINIQMPSRECWESQELQNRKNVLDVLRGMVCGQNENAKST